jgi:FkbM family methyltransferase
MTILGRAKRLGEAAWYVRSRHPAVDVPIPCPLPYGGWFLAHGDAMGARVMGYRLSRHPYEEGQWRLVARLLPQGGTFVDVGANQGFFTMLASRRVGPTGKVIAFEPALTEARKLRANLRLNRCRNVTVEEIALGAERATAEFYMYLGHQGSWSGLRQGAEDVEVQAELIRVPVVPLDAYFAEHGLDRLDVMKVDVEGGELNVLKGAKGVIERHRPFVLCEVEPRRTRQWNYDAGAILEELTRSGYQWRTVTRDGAFGEATAAPGDGANLVAVPAEKLTAA